MPCLGCGLPARARVFCVCAWGGLRVQSTLTSSACFLSLPLFGQVTPYLGYSSLQDFFPTMELRPNPGCTNTQCLQRQQIWQVSAPRGGGRCVCCGCVCGVCVCVCGCVCVGGGGGGGGGVCVCGGGGGQHAGGLGHRRIPSGVGVGGDCHGPGSRPVASALPPADSARASDLPRRLLKRGSAHLLARTQCRRRCRSIHPKPAVQAQEAAHGSKPEAAAEEEEAPTHETNEWGIEVVAAPPQAGASAHAEPGVVANGHQAPALPAGLSYSVQVRLSSGEVAPVLRVCVRARGKQPPGQLGELSRAVWCLRCRWAAVRPRRRRRPARS
jgi:hypothetical protein